MKTFFSLAIILSCLEVSSALHAEDNSCWVTAPPQDDVWVKVYDSDRDGNRGPLIWKGKIEAGQEHKITSTQGHIRYSYTRDPYQPYQGENSVGCYDDRRIGVD